MTRSWFETTAKANFEKFLLPEAGKPDLLFLQIGAFKGEASVWLMENVLTNESSRLIDVDPWEDMGINALSTFDMEEVFDEYERAIEPYKDRVTVCPGTSNRFFGRGDFENEFDFIYIDGDHQAVNVMEDAVHAYRALKPWGLLCFDDYLYGAAEPRIEAPATAIDMVKVLYDGKLDLVGIGAQAWMCKRG